jgi:DNA-binding CsgD family transcriptional regulator
MQAAAQTRIASAPAPAGRAFLTSALGERSPAALTASFRAALAAEGVTRHFCARHGDNGQIELLACDYPFDPEAVAEIGRLRFEIGGAQGERLSVTMAGAGLRGDSGRRARLHGYAMLYATCLPALLAAGEPQSDGAALSEDEAALLERLLLGESEGDIAAADKIPVRTIEMRIRAACAKLGTADARHAIVVAAQRGFLNNRR